MRGARRAGRACVAWGLALAALLAVAGRAAGADGAGFSKGDVITVIVPFAAGGGLDTYARLVQPFLEEELGRLAGLPLRVVVVNVAGAGGQLGHERLYRASPDGRTLALTATGGAISQQVLFGAALDLAKLTYLMQLDRPERSIMIRASAFPGARTLDDVLTRSRQRSVLVGTLGLTTAPENFLLEFLLNAAGAGFKADYVHFRGTSEIVASMLRAEVELCMVPTSGGDPYVRREKDLRWLVTLGAERSPVAPDVPTLLEQGAPNALKITEAIGHTRRVFLAPPGLPEATRALVTRALGAALARPELLERAARANLPLHPESGEVAREAVLRQMESFRRVEVPLRERLGLR